MASFLPFVGPLISGLFNLGATKSVTGGATQAASEIEKRNLEARQYLEGRAQQGRDDLLQQFALGREFLEPYINSGHLAADTLAPEVVGGALNRPFTLADFQRDPGYEFRRTEGQRGLQGSAAAGGSLFSGGTLKALDRYNQNFASNEFAAANKRFTDAQSQRYNQLFGLSEQGRGAATTGAGMYQSAGGALLNEGMQLGELGGAYIQDTGYAQGRARAERGSAYGDFYNNLGQQLSGPISDVATDWWRNRRPRQSARNFGGPYVG